MLSHIFKEASLSHILYEAFIRKAISVEVMGCLLDLVPGEAVLVLHPNCDKESTTAAGIFFGKPRHSLLGKLMGDTQIVSLLNGDLLTQLAAGLSAYNPSFDRGARRQGDCLQTPTEAGHLQEFSYSLEGRSYTIEGLIDAVDQWCGKTLLPYLEKKFDCLTICTSGDNHGIPWHRLPSIAPFQPVVYPGLRLYLLAQERKKKSQRTGQNALSTVACADPYFCMEPASNLPAARATRFKPIPYSVIEVGMVARLSGSAVVANADELIESWEEQELSYLHLACHACWSHGYLHLGSPFYQGEILQSGIRAHVVFLSACLSGKIRDSGRNPQGIAITFFMNGAKVVIGSAIEVPDIFMPIFVGLVHFHAKETFSTMDDVVDKWYHAAMLAREQFGEAAWPKDFPGFIAQVYAATLLAEKQPGQDAFWIEHYFNNCYWIDEKLFPAVRVTLERSDSSRWQDAIAEWFLLALLAMQEDKHHPNRKVFRTMADFIMILGNGT